MINKAELTTAVAAVITTALETEPSPFPESMAYLAMGGNLSEWEDVKSVLLGAKLVTISGHAISLTAKGRDLATKCNAVLSR